MSRSDQLPLSPGITVVIPAWGEYVDEHLPAAIGSVRRQESDRPIQVLVVDNASNIPIPQYDDIAVIRADTRLTLGGARNLGIAAVRSDYLLCLDADDELVSDSLPKLMAVLDVRPDLVAVSGRLVHRSSNEPYHWPHPWTYWWNRNLPGTFVVAECYRPCVPLGASVVRTAVAQHTPGYGLSPDSAEDWLFGVSLAIRGRIELLDEPGLVYESRPGGVWSRQTRWRQHARHRKEVRRRLREDPATPSWLRSLLPVLAVAHELDSLRKLR